MRIGFEKDELRSRYDVQAFAEDSWHLFCGQRMREIVQSVLSSRKLELGRVLNAGCGVYSLGLAGWSEVAVDLFESPLNGRQDAVCADLRSLPFDCSSFQAVVCVGEVIGYCDPQLVFPEFNRVLQGSGVLICDFGSSTSLRHLRRSSYGRQADLIVDTYNGSDEKVWIYHPEFIRRLLKHSGFSVSGEFGTHTWSALARSFGISPSTATVIERRLGWLRLARHNSDVVTIVAVKIEDAKG